MKATLVAVFAVLFAVAAATESQRLDNPSGECPPVNGKTPVYLMDQVYRNVFYECDNGRPIRRNCPNGLVFDPKIEVCNFPSSETEAYGPVGTCPKTDGPFLKYLRDGSNMSVFYVCVNGQPRKFNCADGLIFNPILEACFTSA